MGGAGGARRRSPAASVVIVAVVIGVLLIAGAFAGRTALTVAVIVVQLAVASSWHDLLRAPGAVAGSFIGLATGVAASVVLSVRADSADLGPLVIVVVGGFFAAFIQQLLANSVEGPARLSGLAATSGLVLVEGLTACWLAVPIDAPGPELVVAGVLGAVVAVLVITGVGSASWSVVVALLAAMGLGAVTAVIGASESAGVLEVALVAVSGGLAAVCGCQVRRLAGRAARMAPATVGALPLALAGPATFIASRLFAG